MAHEEYCDECNKKIDYLEWTASDDGGYMAFCSEKCGIKYIKENAKDFLCHQDQDGKRHIANSILLGSSDIIPYRILIHK